MPSCIFFPLLIVCSLTVAIPSVRAEPVSLDSFARDAPVAWDKHRQRSSDIGGTVQVRMRTEVKDRPAILFRSEEYNCFAEGSAVAKQIRFDEAGKKFQATAYVYNPQYSFVVRQNEDNDLWTLKSIAMNESQSAWKFVRGLNRPRNRDLTQFGKHVLDREFLANPAIKKSTLSIEGSFACITFSRNPDQTGGAEKWTKAEIVFDPGNYWVIRNCRLFLGTSGRHEVIENSYRVVDGFPIITKRAINGFETADEIAPTQVFVEEFDLDYPSSKMPVTTFALSGFGLPEPPGSLQTEKPFNWFLLALVGGLAFVALGLWRLRSRQQLAQDAE